MHLHTLSCSGYPHLFSCRWMSVSQAGIYNSQQRDIKRYKPFQQSNTHIQAERDISMPEVSFTLPSLFSRLVYSDFISCLLCISFKTHIQSTKHFLVHKKDFMFVWTVAQRYCTCDNTSGCYVTLFLQTRET